MDFLGFKPGFWIHKTAFFFFNFTETPIGY